MAKKDLQLTLLDELLQLLLAWEIKASETGFDSDYLSYLRNEVQENKKRILQGLSPQMGLQRTIVDSWPIIESEMTPFQTEFGRTYLKLCRIQ